LFIYRANCEEDENDIDEIVQEIQNAATRLGCKFADPYLMCMPNLNAKTWMNALLEEIEADRPELVVSAFFDKGGALYQQLKQFLLLDHGIPHQNLQPLKFLKCKNR
jgi:hypothetical protein